MRLKAPAQLWPARLNPESAQSPWGCGLGLDRVLEACPITHSALNNACSEAYLQCTPAAHRAVKYFGALQGRGNAGRADPASSSS